MQGVVVASVLNACNQTNIPPARLSGTYQFTGGMQVQFKAERPFNETLKPGHINYYNLKEMLTLSHVHVVVALDGAAIIGSGYARIESSKPYLQHQQMRTWVSCMWSRITADRA